MVALPLSAISKTSGLVALIANLGFLEIPKTQVSFEREQAANLQERKAIGGSALILLHAHNLGEVFSASHEPQNLLWSDTVPQRTKYLNLNHTEWRVRPLCKLNIAIEV